MSWHVFSWLTYYSAYDYGGHDSLLTKVSSCQALRGPPVLILSFAAVRRGVMGPLGAAGSEPAAACYRTEITSLTQEMKPVIECKQVYRRTGRRGPR